MYGSLKNLLACLIGCVLGSLATPGATVQPLSLSGQPVNPFAHLSPATVFLFVRTDCPITNRYAPELARIADEFSRDHVAFWLVYADRSETATSIQNHVAEYHLPGTPLRDPQHQLVAYAHVTVAPEVAVFDKAGRLEYHGRIDDRYVAVGKSRPAAQVHDLEDAIREVLAGKPVANAETRAIGCSLADLQ